MKRFFSLAVFAAILSISTVSNAEYRIEYPNVYYKAHVEVFVSRLSSEADSQLAEGEEFEFTVGDGVIFRSPQFKESFIAAGLSASLRMLAEFSLPAELAANSFFYQYLSHASDGPACRVLILDQNVSSGAELPDGLGKFVQSLTANGFEVLVRDQYLSVSCGASN
jgi:hypothetical protein|tara:strand:- start:1217 stop:1714 length:498 start_codon:yes stop_codon:yes gene_type:complete